MEWQDDGIMLGARPHGENSAIVEVLTRSHGRHFGVLRGGASRKMSAHLQPGTDVSLRWRARLEDQLGIFTLEPIRSRADLIADRQGLAALNAVTAMLSYALPEREPHPRLHLHSSALLDIASKPGWAFHYLAWELALLDELGFGLDLSHCAVTGETEDLAFVSPRTGRAVSRNAAGDWASRLLPLPPALLGRQDSALGVLQGMVTTGHFLSRHFPATRGGHPLPEARARLQGLIEKQAGVTAEPAKPLGGEDFLGA